MAGILQDMFGWITTTAPLASISNNSVGIMSRDSGGIGNFTFTKYDTSTPFLPQVIFVVFGSAVVGAFARMLASYLFNIPYTVLLLIIGLAIGITSRNVPVVKAYTTSVTHLDPHIIIYVFLPVIIFEAGYKIDGTSFHRHFWRLITITVVAMGISVASVGYFCFAVFFTYEWSLIMSFLFAAIVSATDSSAISVVLNEFKATKKMSELLKGEALINEGLAIVLFDLLETFAEGDHFSGLAIIRLTLRKVLVGPMYGFLVGQLVVVLVGNVFNDAVVEITITLAAAYLTFFVSEGLLGSSGVLSVVVLGITMAHNRSAVHEIEDFLMRFWEVLAFLAKTLIFIFAGMLLTERAANLVTPTDVVFNLALYGALNIIRAFTLIIVSPVLPTKGCRLTITTGFVLTWGAIRGPVSLVLALIFYQNNGIDRTHFIQGKALIHTCGIVLLTLVFNATTMKFIVWALGMCDIPLTRRLTMIGAVKNLREVVTMSTHLYKEDRFLADADWDTVKRHTEINNPYQTAKQEAELNNSVKEENSTSNKQKPTAQEYKQIEEEGRRRILKTEKMAYWRQFEHSAVEMETLRKLDDLVDDASDHPPNLTDISELKRSLKVNRCLDCLKNTLNALQKSVDETIQVPAPRFCIFVFFHTICVSTLFELLTYIAVFANSSIIVWEIVESIKQCAAGLQPVFGKVFTLANYGFVGFYVLEAILKIIGFRCYYFRSKWNMFDLIVLVVAVLEIVLDLTVFKSINPDTCAATVFEVNPILFRFAKTLRVIRIMRILRLVKAIVPQINDLVNSQVSKKVRVGYNSGEGYVTAEEEVLHYLEYIVRDKKNRELFRSQVVNNRHDIIRDMGLFQMTQGGIAVALKTNQAVTRILSNVREAIAGMRSGGLIDDTQATTLTRAVDYEMKQLLKLQPSLPVLTPAKVIGNIRWVRNEHKLVHFLIKYSEVIPLTVGQSFQPEISPKQGLFIIVSGFVRLTKPLPPEPAKQQDEDNDQGSHAVDVQKLTTDSQANTKVWDYLATASVIGESALLTGKTNEVTATCECDVLLYHVPHERMREAFGIFTDEPPLEHRIWRAHATRLACNILRRHYRYFQWSKEKLKVYLEKAKVVVKKGTNRLMDERLTFYVDSSFVVDVVLIHGFTEDPVSGKLWQGPVYIPRKIKKLVLLPGKTDKHVFLILLNEFGSIGMDFSSAALTRMMMAGEAGSIVTDGDEDSEIYYLAPLAESVPSMSRISDVHAVSAGSVATPVVESTSNKGTFQGMFSSMFSSGSKTAAVSAKISSPEVQNDTKTQVGKDDKDSSNLEKAGNLKNIETLTQAPVQHTPSTDKKIEDPDATVL